ncbi:zinc ribbon domain-containing protein [Chamaesiphon sp.]|uniref:zinc ribbon domain-containing protein n=1 Tax=Chamaesiphon sp. TaxID=2814140 RepID=UPI003593CFFF
MIYHWELSTGHQISVDNEGAQTVVTILHTSAGQQQRTSNSFTTGIWLIPPEMSMTPTGGILKVTTPSGESLIQIQGNSIQMQSSQGASQSTSTSSSSTATGIKPMQMGNMQMNMQPMSMKMGCMELNMDATASQKRFCTECGTPVKPTDKFCASCGHKLEL